MDGKFPVKASEQAKLSLSDATLGSRFVRFGHGRARTTQGRVPLVGESVPVSSACARVRWNFAAEMIYHPSLFPYRRPAPEDSCVGRNRAAVRSLITRDQLFSIAASGVALPGRRRSPR